MRALVLLLLAARLAAAEPAMRWDYQPIRVEKPRRWALFASGIGMFAGTWMTTMGVGLHYHEVQLAAPIAGPILHMTQHDDFSMLPMLFSAVLQIAGLACVIVGATTRREVGIPGKWRLVPVASTQAGGIALVGRF
jgi:hypothetical protein